MSHPEKTTNEFEQRRRAEKAVNLADAFTAALLQVWPTELAERFDRTNKDHALLVADHARRASATTWAEVAEGAGIKTPSDLTVAAAIGVLEARFRTAGDNVFDFFDNLEEW